MATGDPHNFGYGICWCGMDHWQDDQTRSYQAGYDDGLKARHLHSVAQCDECRKLVDQHTSAVLDRV